MKRHIQNGISDEMPDNSPKRQKCLPNNETRSLLKNIRFSKDCDGGKSAHYYQVSTALKRSLSIDGNSTDESLKRPKMDSFASLKSQIFRTSNVSPEQIAANINMELKRLQRRRQLHYQRTSSPPPQEAGSSQSCTSLLSQNSLSPSKKDAPLFTFKQVTMICERMLKDRESQVREEYNSVLSNKLAEQYEAFLKFNLDMIHKSLVDSPFSYIS